MKGVTEVGIVIQIKPSPENEGFFEASTTMPGVVGTFKAIARSEARAVAFLLQDIAYDLKNPMPELVP